MARGFRVKCGCAYLGNIFLRIRARQLERAPLEGRALGEHRDLMAQFPGQDHPVHCDRSEIGPMSVAKLWTGKPSGVCFEAALARVLFRRPPSYPPAWSAWRWPLPGHRPRTAWGRTSFACSAPHASRACRGTGAPAPASHCRRGTGGPSAPKTSWSGRRARQARVS